MTQEEMQAAVEARARELCAADGCEFPDLEISVGDMRIKNWQRYEIAAGYELGFLTRNVKWVTREEFSRRFPS